MKYFLLCFISLFLTSCAGGNRKGKAQYQYIKDLQEQKVAVMMGTAAELQIGVQYPGIPVDRFETETDLVQALKQHRCEGIALDGYAAHFLNVETGGGLVELDDALDTMSLAAAFPKGGDAQLRKQFNAFLQEKRASGELQQWSKNWIKHCESATMTKVVLPKTGDPIRVGVCLTLPPTSYLRDQRPVGLDIELLHHFAVYLNRPIELVNLNFTSLITSLTTGKIDMIMASMTATEERAQSVDFSDPYLDYALTVLVRAQNKKGFVPSADAQVAEPEGSFLEVVEDSFHNNLIRERRYEMVWRGLWTTLVIAFFSAILGTALGALVCFLKMRKSPIVHGFASGYIQVMRGTPVLVLLLIMFYVVFNRVNIDPVLVSVITFALNFSAYVSEMFRSSIEGIDKGQTEAGIALGFSKMKTFLYVVLPQAIKHVLPVYKGELISMVKMTSIVGYIAVEDLTKVSDIIRSRTFDALFPLVMVAILYFIIAWLFAAALDAFGRRFK